MLNFWVGALDGIARTLGFTSCTRTSLTCVTLTGAVLGVTRTSLQQLLGARNFALSFRREALRRLDVAFLRRSDASHAPSHSSYQRSTGNDLLLVCGMGPLLQADLRASPRLELFATDASPSGAGACVAPVTSALWRTLYNLAEEQGEHVRLSWGGSSPPVELTPSRCAHVPRSSLPPIGLCTFGYRFRAPRSHQRARAHGADVARGTVGTQTVRGQPRRPRSGLRRPLLLKASQLWTPAACIRVSQCISVNRLIVGTILGKIQPTRPSRGTSLACWKRSLPFGPNQAPNLQFGSAAAARELKLLREPLPSAAVHKIGSLLSARGTTPQQRFLNTTGADSSSSPPVMLSQSVRDLRQSCCRLTPCQGRPPGTSRLSSTSKFSSLFVVVAGNAWLAERGLPCLVKWTVWYLRSAIHQGNLSAS